MADHYVDIIDRERKRLERLAALGQESGAKQKVLRRVSR
jgi:hypothetical protein